MDVISDLLAEAHSIAKLDGLEGRVHSALALLERDFPQSLQVY